MLAELGPLVQAVTVRGVAPREKDFQRSVQDTELSGDFDSIAPSAGFIDVGVARQTEGLVEAMWPGGAGTHPTFMRAGEVLMAMVTQHCCL